MKGFYLALFSAGICILGASRVGAKTIVYHVPSQYPTIQSAVYAVPKHSSVKYKILIAPGTYQENVTISSVRPNIVLAADGTTDATRVVIAAGRGAGPLSIKADHIKVSNLTLENTAGLPEGTDQPLEGRALYTRGDEVSFDNVRFIGLQDTIFFDTFSVGRSYFSHCYISGAVDFICGGGMAFFDTCTVCNVVKPGYIAAPATPPEFPYGFVFWNTTIIHDALVPDDTCYLMRPWGADGATAFINTSLDYHIIKDGWAPWAGHEDTCRANELNSVYLDGVSVDMSKRASWVNATVEPEEYFSKEAVLFGWQP